jgi:biotin transport system substrate-specific component
LLIFLGSIAILTASSRIQVPWYPVPMTLQTLALPLIGAIYGWRMGLATVMSWLALAALGAPVLAGPNAGLAVFAGPTAGYLAAFPVAAVVAGILATRGWDGRAPSLAFASMLLANAICLGAGALWLSVLVGMQQAVAVGVLPFLSGGLVKAGLAAAILMVINR